MLEKIDNKILKAGSTVLAWLGISRSLTLKASYAGLFCCIVYDWLMGKNLVDFAFMLMLALGLLLLSMRDILGSGHSFAKAEGGWAIFNRYQRTLLIPAFTIEALAGQRWSQVVFQCLLFVFFVAEDIDDDDKSGKSVWEKIKLVLTSEKQHLAPAVGLN